MNNKDSQFKSNFSKLLTHTDVLFDFQTTGIIRPITLDLAPTNKCRRNCSFCSTKNRDRSQELSYEDAVKITDWYINAGIKSIELTGDGEPTLWKPINKYINKYSKLVKISMITNSDDLDQIPYNILEQLTWLRISINMIDTDLFIPNFVIPDNVILSFNYVWNEKSDRETMLILESILELYPKAICVKVQENVFEETTDDDFYLIKEFTYKNNRIFYSSKPMTIQSDKCYYGNLKPHINADGNIYRCSASCLEDKKFDKQYKIGDINHPPSLKPTKFDTSKCKFCFFGDTNKIMENIEHPMEHSEFL